MICKLLERLIKDHLVDFLVTNNFSTWVSKSEGMLNKYDVMFFVRSPVDIIYLSKALKKPLTKCHMKDYYLN